MSTEGLSFAEYEKFNLPFLEQVALVELRSERLPIPRDDFGMFSSALHAEFNQKPLRVLDAGFGDARYIHLFRDFIYDGVDVSECMVAHARQAHPQLSFRRASFARTGVPDATYHGIWACCSLNTTPKAELPRVLAEFKRTLVRRGLAYVMMPNPGLSEEHVGPSALGVPCHFSYWCVDEFEQSLRTAGFKIVSATEDHLHGVFSIIAQKP